jgi:hypothetical protein
LVRLAWPLIDAENELHDCCEVVTLPPAAGLGFTAQAADLTLPQLSFATSMMERRVPILAAKVLFADHTVSFTPQPIRIGTH